MKATPATYGIAHKMQMEALAENHPQHVIHVQNQIAYADAVREAPYDAIMNYIDTNPPKMIEEAILKMQKEQKVQVELDEKSVQTVTTKIANLITPLFQ